jgi:aminopeptidase N
LVSLAQLVRFSNLPWLLNKRFDEQLFFLQLIAFAVGEFEYIESNTSATCTALPDPVKVRVYTTKGLSGTGQFALACAVKILEFFSEVYGEPYPLPKLDMLAVPDFSAGAMENMGLVTVSFSEIALMFL